MKPSKLSYQLEDRLSAKGIVPIFDSCVLVLNKVLSKGFINDDYRKISAAHVVPGKMLNWSVLICGDVEMRAYQNQYKNLDRATDVLSFPTLEGSGPMEPNHLGDVILSIDTVKRHAVKYKRSLKDEMLEVLIHSYLHLLGYDHVGVSRLEAQSMRDLQSSLFEETKAIKK